MKPKLAALQAMFPHISMSVLQERLAAAQGHLPNAVKVVCLTSTLVHMGILLAPVHKHVTFQSRAC